MENNFVSIAKLTREGKTQGACEQASTCVEASENCRRVPSSPMICDPSKRYMYCYAYKQKLGMVFDKDLGVYILPQWKEELMRRLKQ